MNIQFQTDHHTDGNDKTRIYIESLITKELKRLENKIQRITIHLTDENGDKDSPNDKKCLLEAQLNGSNPIVVSNHANTHHDAAKGAIEKLKHSLDNLIPQLNGH